MFFVMFTSDQVQSPAGHTMVSPSTAEFIASLTSDSEQELKLMVNGDAVLALPFGIVTLPGTEATVELLLDRDTTAPPLGAGPLRVTVPVERSPPTTDEGFNERERSTGYMSNPIAFELPPPRRRVVNSDTGCPGCGNVLCKNVCVHFCSGNKTGCPV